MNTPDAEATLKRKILKQLATETDPIVCLRLKCLLRGSNGIRGLSRVFRIMDDDRSFVLTFDNLKKGFHDYGLDVSDEDARAAFDKVDTNGSGSVSFDEFLNAIRPPMNEARTRIVELAFKTLDVSGNGAITTGDLKKSFYVKDNLMVKSGEWTEERCLEEFVKSFDDPKNRDGKVTLNEFIDYYSGVSAGIDDDGYFDLIIRNAYKI